MSTGGVKRINRILWRDTLICSNSGMFLCGFSIPLGHNEIVQTELDAILEGIFICKQLSLGEFVIETDRSVAFLPYAED